MTQVSLSPEAYAKLRRAKAGQESFSDVVLRLLAEAQAGRRDPMAFVQRRHQLLQPSAQAALDDLERGRDEWS